ncbi:Ger(x)C family spore germination protein [Paenibacillus sp. SYP-B3998]|uniref:Ger(X)C family spore germination protein n=1 Tax=Paenibacillus sp. SYP-B3998 TaxID=2678564 RepID=A0A6G3ZYP5_9BACL|nr:Ger(x)C family spore germination protein [Paenibacillus sp. SYP-B3998]NEW07220.1 Ger(x)C family spore germination protein [Paenibacillus sp. SYP-B3998]
MKERCGIFLALAALLFVTGCGKAVYIENQQFILAHAMDLNDEKKLVIYVASSVFSSEATKRYKVTTATVDTIRESRKKLGSKINGSLAPGKLQSILIGKKMLQQTNVLPYLDVLFRDPKNDINANMIVVDGSVKEVMYTNMSDKGELGGVIKQLVESTYKSRITVQTTLQKFHQQMMDSGMTPCITEMKVEKNDLVISGTALLHKDGTYATSLNYQESSLLFLLQHNLKKRISLTFHLPSEIFQTDEKMSYVSFDIKKAKLNFKAKFEGDRLAIEIPMKVQIDLTERLFTLDMEKQSKALEYAIEQELKKECETLIKKVQKHQVDPFHFGIYMRAYNYKNWKGIQSNWGTTLSKATVKVSPKVTIKSIGVSE